MMMLECLFLAIIICAVATVRMRLMKKDDVLNDILFMGINLCFAIGHFTNTTGRWGGYVLGMFHIVGIVFGIICVKRSVKHREEMKELDVEYAKLILLQDKQVRNLSSIERLYWTCKSKDES
jgi:Ca2+/Na+ antiporter